jgi:hypothetical protein
VFVCLPIAVSPRCSHQERLKPTAWSRRMNGTSSTIGSKEALRHMRGYHGTLCSQPIPHRGGQNAGAGERLARLFRSMFVLPVVSPFRLRVTISRPCRVSSPRQVERSMRIFRSDPADRNLDRRIIGCHAQPRGFGREPWPERDSRSS